MLAALVRKKKISVKLKEVYSQLLLLFKLALWSDETPFTVSLYIILSTVLCFVSYPPQDVLSKQAQKQVFKVWSSSPTYNYENHKFSA